MTDSNVLYKSNVTICDLNDECLYEVFDWLTLQEKCGVQRVSRRWKRVSDNVIAGEERLKLYMFNQAPFHKPVRCSHAYYSAELEEFFRMGVMDSCLKGFFEKFADNIKHLTITNSAFGIEDEGNYIKLNKAVFGQLLALFKNLKSVDLFELDIDGSNWKDLSKFAQKLESFTFEATESNQELKSFAKTCKQLKSFDETLKYYNKEDLDIFENLEEIDFKVTDTEELQRILAVHPKLTKLTVFICAVDDEEGENFGSFCRLFRSFAKMPSLKGIDLSYKGGGSGFQATSHILSQVESLIFYEITITVSDMQILARQFPSLKSFCLLGFQFSNPESLEFQEVVKEFLDAIATLTSLKTLLLEYYAEEEFSQMPFPSSVLSGFLNAEKLLKLRNLSCNCFDIDDCFKAFCELASNNPKQSYAFKEFVYFFPSMKISDEVRSLKPRNVFFKRLFY